MGRFLNADRYVSTGQGIVGYNMFAYCLNNPMKFHDKDGQHADSYAGWIGEELGKLFYEWITGEDHPSRETEQYERDITQARVQSVQDVTKKGLDLHAYQVQLQAEAQYNQDMTVIAMGEYYAENPQKAIDHGFTVIGVCGLYCAYVKWAGVTIPATIATTINVAEILGTLWGAYRMIEEICIDIWGDEFR